MSRRLKLKSKDAAALEESITPFLQAIAKEGLSL